jgi:hypothetical protein
VVVGRKNHYGSKSRRGTEVAALFYSLLESGKLAGVEPKPTCGGQPWPRSMTSRSRFPASSVDSSRRSRSSEAVKTGIAEMHVWRIEDSRLWDVARNHEPEIPGYAECGIDCATAIYYGRRAAKVFFAYRYDAQYDVLGDTEAP